MFLVKGVEASSSKNTQFRILTKDADKPEILLQATTPDLRDEWVKILGLVLSQRKVREVEEQQSGQGGVEHPPAALKLTSSYDKDDVASSSSAAVVGNIGLEDDTGSKSAASGSGAARDDDVAVRVLPVTEDQPTAPDSMSKEVHEKFAEELRSHILEKDLLSIRSMLDPVPPRDALLWFYQKELSRTVLHFAVYEGDVKIVSLLANADRRLLELSDHIGWTPLHLAAYRGNLAVGEELLSLGSDVNCSDNTGRTPLYVALSAGHPEFARMLFQKKAAGSGWDEVHAVSLTGIQARLEKFDPLTLALVHEVSGLTPLHLASSSTALGSAEAVLFLIEKGQNVEVNVTDRFGRSPLFFAAAAGAMQSLRVLLGKGADPKHEDATKRTALHLAAGAGHAEICEVLIDKGSPHSPEDEVGWTPLHLAAYHNHPNTVRALIGRHARLEARGMRATTPLMLCLADDAAPCAQLLVQAGADPNSLNRDGQTSLFEAVVNKSLETVKLLVEHDVNVNRVDESDQVAIHSALDWPAGFLYLLERGGADPNKQLEDGTTLLYEMSKRGQLEAVRCLHAKGALLETASTDKLQTALMMAAGEDHLDVVKYLLAEGVSVNTADATGQSALHYACAANAASVVEALLAAGADKTKRDAGGSLPLHVACAHGFEQCVNLLGREGIHIETLLGKTPLMLAAEANSYSCVTLLLEGCEDVVVTAKDAAGRTALHYALKAGDVDSSTSLIWAGSSCTHPDADGVRPFHLAARMGKKKVLVEMVKRVDEVGQEKLDPAWADKSNRNVMHYAAAGGSADALQIVFDLIGEDEEKKRLLINAPDSHGTTCLHFACEFNYSELVKRLLAEGADPAVKNDAGLYPLHTAAKKGKESLEVMLGCKTGPGIDEPDSEGLSPLLIACLHGNLVAAALLLERGCSKEVADVDGMSVGHAVVESGNGQLLTYVGKEQKCPLRMVDKTGAEPIHLAASNGSAECIGAFLGLDGIDFNALDSQGRTPLLLACAAGHTKCVQLLAQDRRVDVNLASPLGLGPLHMASVNGKLDCVKILLAREDLDVMATDGQGRTLLHNVVLSDSVELTRFCLKAGLDVNAETTQKVTPLHEAAVRGSLRAAKILIDAGANVDAAAVQGLTPLHNSASFAQDDVIELLVKAGADIEAKSERGLTPCHCSAAMGHSRTLVLLVKLGAEVDSVDVLGETPLMKAASAGSASSCTVLIERGADVNRENNSGESSYAKARRKGHAKVCAVLRDNA